MNTVFARKFSAAHRVWNDESACANIHGHNYDVKVTVDVGGRLTEQGFAVPFDEVKKVIDAFDHCLILDASDPLLAEWPQTPQFAALRVQQVDGPPSTERLAATLARDVARAAKAANPWSGAIKVEVRLSESASIEATAIAVVA